MEQLIGISMILAFFAFIFVVIAKDVGVLPTIKIFAISIFSTSFITVGVSLL